MSQYPTVDPILLGLAYNNVNFEKAGFVPGGDPSMMGGGGGGDPGMGGGDPSMGGAPPMDPSMMGGAPPMDPSMGGGAPPTDPTAGAQGATPDLNGMIQQAVQAALASSGGGAGAKPKIDINVILLQLLKLMAKVCDALGIKVSASEMVVTPQDLNAMAQGGPGAAAVQDQQGGGAGQGSAIQPIQPMQGASPDMAKASEDMMRMGTAYDTRRFAKTMHLADAVGRAMRGV